MQENSLLFKKILLESRFGTFKCGYFVNPDIQQSLQLGTPLPPMGKRLPLQQQQQPMGKGSKHILVINWCIHSIVQPTIESTDGGLYPDALS